MKFGLPKYLLLIGVMVAAALVCPAQPSGARPIGLTTPSSFIGETLRYEGKVSRLLMSVSVADLTFTTVSANSQGDVVIKTEATSKGTLLKLFRYSFSQTYQSTLDDQFRILRTTKHDVQKERVRDGDADFDYAMKRVTYVEIDPKDPNRPPRRIASEIQPITQDMISAIYYLRSQPLTVGRRFEITVSDSGLVYRVPVIVTAREQQKSVIGQQWCFKVEPLIFGPGRLIEQRGKMVLWLADNAARTPVKAQIDSQYGKIEIKLKASGHSIPNSSDGGSSRVESVSKLR